MLKLREFLKVCICAIIPVVWSVEDLGPPHDNKMGDYAVDDGYQNRLKKLEFFDCVGAGKGFGKAPRHADLDLNITQTIEKYGFETEIHTVHTEDGYILTVIRVPGGELSPRKEGKVPVYLNHGLFGSAFAWVFLYGNQSLTYKLVNAGYDVFLGNVRGTTLSDKHEWLNPKSDEYWDFSWHEAGKYDVPAVIDHILNVTGSQDTYYVGHSMGGSEYLVAMSDRPEYGNKIKVGFLLGPAVFVSLTRNPAARLICGFVPGPYHEYWKAEYGNYVDEGKLMSRLVGDPTGFCSSIVFKCGFCDSSIYLLGGYDPDQMNKSVSSYLQAKYFDRTSVKTLAHYDQSLTRDSFNYYDYGVPERNKEVYGNISAPPYPLEKIKAPTVMYYAENDIFIPPATHKKAASGFSPGVLKENNRVQFDAFTHLDFLIANDLEKLVTNRILWIMDNEKYVVKDKPLNHQGKGTVIPNSKIKRKYFPPVKPIYRLPGRVGDKRKYTKPKTTSRPSPRRVTAPFTLIPKIL